VPPELVPWVLYEPEPESGILWIKFNRPERMNANFGGAGQRNSTANKLIEYMQNGDDDPDIRYIVVTGVGRAFHGGSDFRGPQEGEDAGELLPGHRGPREGVDATRQGFFHGTTRMMREISQIRKPTIAMMNGPAAGLGMDVSLQCDLRIGCENTRILTYYQRGQIMENGSAYYLPRIIGLGRTLEFAYKGQIDAEEAYRWGILNHLVPSAELEQFTRDLCRKFSRVTPISQWINKRIIRAGLDSTLETVMVMTSNAASILVESEDRQEATRAFNERREPVFKGR
jgi:enoyl-CoA hydratase/carnithine racemase